jgi:hypothetical protein
VLPVCTCPGQWVPISSYPITLFVRVHLSLIPDPDRGTRYALPNDPEKVSSEVSERDDINQSINIYIIYAVSKRRT